MSPTLKNTAEVVSFFDDLFDSVNGTSIYSKKSKGKPLRSAVTKASPHQQFWTSAVKKLKCIKFIDHEGKETSVPSLKNWITTLESYKRVWQFLNKKNITIMRPRYFNSDPIENFFGQVRAYNFRNINPNCHTFKCTFRSLLITRFIQFHSESYNCEDDSGEPLLKYSSLFKKNNEEDEAEKLCSPESSKLPSWIGSQSIETSARKERLIIHSRAYTAGWVIGKIKNKCAKCETNLTSRESNFEKESVNNWISYKEYKSIKQNKLTYPSEQAVRFFGTITQEANKYLENKPHKKNIIENIKNEIKSKYLFDFLTCEIHKDAMSECFYSLTLRLAVFNWCNVINRILKGTDVSRLNNIALPQMQLKAFNKYKSKLKKKKT